MVNTCPGPHAHLSTEAPAVLRVPPTPARVYDEAVNPSEPSRTSSRSLAIAGIALLVLSVPFFIFGLSFLNVKARITFECQPGGPCTLTRKGYLSQEEPVVLQLDALQEARVDRRRARNGDNEYRPVIVTKAQQTLPIAYGWMAQEVKATRVVRAIERFRDAPVQGFSMWHDDRPLYIRTGGMFTAAGVVVLGLGLWLTLKALRRRAQERAQASTAAP